MQSPQKKTCNKSPVLLVHILNEPTCLWRFSTDHAYHQFWTPRQTSPHFLSILTTAIIKDSVIFNTRAHTRARESTHTHAHISISCGATAHLWHLWFLFAAYKCTYLLTYFLPALKRNWVQLCVLFCLSVKWLAVKTASEMTYTVSGGALNSAPTNHLKLRWR